MKTKLTREDVFEKLRELDRHNTKQPDDITLTDVIEKFKWGKHKAKRYLAEMVKNKELFKFEVRGGNGKVCEIWRIP